MYSVRIFYGGSALACPNMHGQGSDETFALSSQQCYICPNLACSLFLLPSKLAMYSAVPLREGCGRCANCRTPTDCRHELDRQVKGADIVDLILVPGILLYQRGRAVQEFLSCGPSRS
jgi:hypothetical protein